MVPDFALSQDDAKVHLDVRLPYVFLSKLEVEAEGCDVVLTCPPYLLRLRLPGHVDGDAAAAKLDAERDHHVLVTLPKRTPGEHFADLDLPAKLLDAGAAKVARSLPPSIEVVSEHEHGDGDGDAGDAAATLSAPAGRRLTCDGYGFGAAHRGVFKALGGECSAWLRVDAEATTAEDRSAARLANECDLDVARCTHDARDDEDDVYAAALDWLAGDDDADDALDLATQDKVAKIPRRAPPLLDSPAQRRAAVMVIFDVCIAHCADLSMPCPGEQTCESARTLCALAAPFAWLETYERRDRTATPPLRDLVLGAVRRQLTTCFIRRWDLAVATVRRTARALAAHGRRPAILAFVQVRDALMRGGTTDDGRAVILLRLIVEPAIAWLQRTGTDDEFEALATEALAILDEWKDMDNEEALDFVVQQPAPEPPNPFYLQ
ncbi:hypothetical protein M885DRAFT_534490 [Pelagophyceae sp. CCMP2097]|nr:hypothetical protein M885DRAFT_534490 [Pelagophyceae sp. CCMP2097]